MRVSISDKSLSWHISVLTYLASQSYATYSCVYPTQKPKFLRPPKDDCIAAADYLIFSRGSKSARLFVTKEYSTGLSSEIVVPRSYKHGSCHISVDLINNYAIESSSIQEIGLNAQTLALMCFKEQNPEPVGGEASIGQGKALKVLVHGNWTTKGPNEDADKMQLDTWD